MSITALQHFPVARFTCHSNFRFYYAYGTALAENFLDSITEVKEPTILSLGCGDLQSCFYTIWKNFHPQYKHHFGGVHFVLNDCSAAVLARNILLLYLCIQMPTEMEDKKKWVAAMWSIWYCHELLPDHEHVLRDSLNNLLKWSENVNSWSNESNNPLRNIVKFASLQSLHEIREAWKMWFHSTVNVKPVEEMRSARLKQIQSVMQANFHNIAASLMDVSFGQLKCNIPHTQLKKSEEEFNSYLQCGCSFAECVLTLPVAVSTKSVNLTLYEQVDATYTLPHVCSPYTCFFQTFQFSPEQIRKNGVSSSVLDQLIVENEHFTDYPLLANSVQQFAMWLSVSAGALIPCLVKEIPNISFTFHCSDALSFCQNLHHNSNLFIMNKEPEPVFHAIYYSDLCGHTALPNLVLSAIPLLKENCNLFTSTLEINPGVEKCLKVAFGCEAKLLPLLFGVRCIGHEGNYSSSTSVQPTPIAHRLGSTKLLIWQRISTLPLKITPLNKNSSILKALSSAIVTVLTSYFDRVYEHKIISQLCTETVIHIILSFFSQIDTEDINSYQYWDPFCCLLCEQQQLKPFMVSLQTQALLHGLHFHLTVSESDCPFCTGKPVGDYIDQFSVAFDYIQGVTNTTFAIFISRNPRNITADFLVTSFCEADMHIIDSVAGSQNVKLDFYAPQFLASKGYHITVCTSEQEGFFPRTVMQGKLADCIKSKPTYCFRIIRSSPPASTSTFGTVIQHFGDGDIFESIVSLSNDAMTALHNHKLATQCISESKIVVTCAGFQIEICYPYAVDYNKMKIRLSKKNRTVTIIALRRMCYFYEEKPLFTVMPDNILSLPPMLLSEPTLMQYTTKDHEMLKHCNTEPAMMPVVVNLRKIVKDLFQFFDRNFIHFLPPNSDAHGLLVEVHNQVFDLQNMTPAIDLSFCTLHMPFDHDFHSHPLMARTQDKDKIRTVTVNEAEYELLRKWFHYFAECTITSSTKPHGCMKLLTNSNFTRAVVYLLYPDRDITADSNDFLQHEYMSTSDAKPQQTQRAGSATEEESERKCSFCGSQSDNLKKCSRCGKAKYCGQSCQTKHWKEHKMICTPQSATHPNTQNPSPPISSSVAKPQQTQRAASATEEESERKCSFCGTQSDILKKCSRCGKAKYCGQGCQTKHWKQHKMICTPQSATHPNTQNPSPPISSSVVKTQQTQRAASATEEESERKCSFCGTQSDILKKCSRCGKAKYCGQGCQTKHWKQHKMICTPQSATHPKTQNPSPPISSSVVKTQQTQNAASSAHLQAALLKNMQKFSEMPQSQFAYNFSLFMFYLTLNKGLSLELYNRSFMDHLEGLLDKDCIPTVKIILNNAIDNIRAFWHVEQALLNQQTSKLLLTTHNPCFLSACCRVLSILASDVRKFVEYGGVELLVQLMKRGKNNPEVCCEFFRVLSSIIVSMAIVNQCHIITQDVMETAITILEESTNGKVISSITMFFLVIGEQDNGSTRLKELGAEKFLRKAIENPEYRKQRPELERWGVPFLESQALHTIFVPWHTIPPTPLSFLHTINWPPLLDSSSPNDVKWSYLSSPNVLACNRKILPLEEVCLKPHTPIAPELNEAAKEQLLKLGLNPNKPLFRVGRMYGSTHHLCKNCEKSGSSEELVIRPHSMTLSQYQLLINNGWYRRGGVKMYRLRCNHNVHCCDWETRVKVEDFDYRTHKSYKKVLRKMPRNRLTVETKPTHFDREAFDLYNEYNMLRHNTPQMSEYFYCKHVVNTPILNQTMDGLDYGTYHQLYKLDGKLVAVGVIDIVPTGIVSIYMWYNVSKEVLKLSFGVYSMLKEIEFVQELSKHNPRMKYYYLQGWNGNNKKLSYKANYSPEEFYCPCVVGRWVRDLAQVDSSKREYMKKRQGEAGSLTQGIDTSKCLIMNSLDRSSSSSSGTGKGDLGRKTEEGDNADSCISHGEESNDSTTSSRKVPKKGKGKSEDKNGGKDENACGSAVYCEAFPVDMIQYQHQTGQSMVDISKVVVCLNYSEYMYLRELFQRFHLCAEQQSVMEQRFAELVVALGPELCSQLVVDLKACLDSQEVGLSPESMQ